MSIPKIIHFCWVSDEPYPEDIKRCMDSWAKKLPDYQIKHWNSNNFDINNWKYAAQALSKKKYAFVSDIVRLYALYTDGGVYLDSDIEVLKSFDNLLDAKAFTGFESYGRIAAWIMASEKGNPLIKEILDFYRDKDFIDANGNTDLTPNTVLLTKILKKHGMKTMDKIQYLDYITIYPERFFCPLNPWTNEINITNDTYCIHYFKGAWAPPEDRYKHKIINKLVNIKVPIMLARVIAKFFVVIKYDGLKGVVREFWTRLKLLFE